MLDRTRAASLLHDTADLIDGIKAKEYGDPDKSFNDIAQMWSIYLNHHISPIDVGMMMVLMKVVRNSGGRHKQDNCIDICGYAALVGSEDEYK